MTGLLWLYFLSVIQPLSGGKLLSVASSPTPNKLAGHCPSRGFNHHSGANKNSDGRANIVIILDLQPCLSKKSE